MGYSYIHQWFRPGLREARGWRVALAGILFGGLAVILMVSRIQLDSGIFIDARAVPVALVALFEGWPAGVIAGAMAAAYRIWLGGPGAIAGSVGVLAAGLLGGLVHVWARREGGVAPRHAFALTALAFLATFASFLLLGQSGLGLFGQTWLPLLLVYVIGIGIIARALHDVVERTRLIAEQERFRSIIDEATDAIRIVDAHTMKILESNRMDCEICGYSREEMIGRDIRDFWPAEPELRALREAAVHDTVTRGFTRRFGLPHRVRSGKIIYIDATRRMVEHEGRRYVLTIYRDASERVAFESARREASELRAVTLLAGAAAHEINNPLSVIVGALGLLGRRTAPETQESKWIENGLQASHRIQEIVSRMTKITRVESTPAQGGLPPILDIKKSSDVGSEQEAQ